MSILERRAFGEGKGDEGGDAADADASAKGNGVEEDEEEGGGGGLGGEGDGRGEGRGTEAAGLRPRRHTRPDRVLLVVGVGADLLRVPRERLSHRPGVRGRHSPLCVQSQHLHEQYAVRLLNDVQDPPPPRHRLQQDRRGVGPSSQRSG